MNIVVVRCLAALDRCGIVTSIKGATLITGVAALGLVAWSLAQQVWPFTNASAGYAQEGPMSNDQASTEGSDVPNTAIVILMAAVALTPWSYGFFRARQPAVGAIP